MQSNTIIIIYDTVRSRLIRYRPEARTDASCQLLGGICVRVTFTKHLRLVFVNSPSQLCMAIIRPAVAGSVCKFCRVVCLPHRGFLLEVPRGSQLSHSLEKPHTLVDVGPSCTHFSFLDFRNDAFCGRWERIVA